MIKAIGLDLGKKTLGIACSDSLGFVHGVETYRFKSFDFNDAAIHALKIANEKDIKTFALGYPLHLNGTPSEMSENVLSFKKIIEEMDNSIKIELIDERMSTLEAHKTLNELDVNHKTRMEKVDTLAACEILDTFIRRIK